MIRVETANATIKNILDVAFEKNNEKLANRIENSLFTNEFYILRLPYDISANDVPPKFESTTERAAFVSGYNSLLKELFEQVIKGN